MQHPGLILVAARELRWMRRDRVALLLILGVPLFAFAILAWTFSSAVVRGLGVSVVDADRSPTSTIFVQAIASSPGIDLRERSGDLTSAMRAIRSGDALGAVYIPENFERDLLADRRPQIVVFYNTQYFTPGNNVAKSLRETISATAATLSPLRGATIRPTAAGPLVVEQYVLTNPALNYAQFLLRAVLPTVLHVVTAIAAGYAVGSEFSRRSLRAWIRAAGGSPSAALIGKLAPLFGILILQMVVVLGIIHWLYHLPFRGDAPMMAAAASLLIVAYLAIGALIQLLVRNLPLGLSITGIICSPAFGYAGIGFPVIAMEAFPRIWGAGLPLRWYIQILFDQAARGVPTSASAEPFAILAGLAIIFSALAWLRLRAVARTGGMKPISADAEKEVPAGHGIGNAFVAEWRRVLADRSVLGLFVLAPLLYGVFYPQPYLGQLVRNIPIAVVDQDLSELSRRIIQTVDADEAIKVALRAETLAEAQVALYARKVFGILAIPAGTEREVLKGNRARLPAYVDSAYFMVFNRTLQGILDSTNAVTDELVSHGGRLDASLSKAALARVEPVELLMAPLYNPTGGYASYVVPAAFVLILQQTLLMGAAMLGGVAFERGGKRARGARGAATTVLGQGFAHFTLYLPALALYLIVLPRIYGFSTLGHILDLFLLAAPFILAVSFLGQFAGTLFKRRETAVLLFLATSLPLFFMVGVSWPADAIPEALRTASRVFPSTSAIDGLVRINQMGAHLHEVLKDWTTLWIMTGIYFLLAVAAGRLGREKETDRAR
jgi:ABC-2 type transport system permease protein